MDSGSEEQDDAPVEQELTGKRGRPVGKVDQNQTIQKDGTRDQRRQDQSGADEAGCPKRDRGETPCEQEAPS